MNRIFMSHFKYSLINDDYFGLIHTSLFVIDTPHKQLWCAVLKKAIEDCLIAEDVVTRWQNTIKLRREAATWLKNTDSSKIGSIRWILEYITYDADRALNEVNKFIKDPKSVQAIKKYKVMQKLRND